MFRRAWWLFLLLLAMLMLAYMIFAVALGGSFESPSLAIMRPTVTPVPPTDTPLPPTGTPTATPPPPTEVPANTPPPPTEVPTSTPAFRLIVSEASGACQHPYYPVRSDTTWRYQTRVGGDEPMVYAVTFDDIGDQSFNSLQTFPGSTSESRWLCDEAGLIPEEIASFLPIEVPGFGFETLGHSGALIPPPASWQVGATWATGYTLQVTTKVLGIDIRSQADIRVDSQITGVESVVVAAGSFPQAVRIDSTGMASANTLGRQMEAPFSFSHWYVEGLGLVKVVADVQGTPFDLELLSVEP
ncbi:MAG: hypothetical protein Kow0063_06100 [Anaerolineae bacterium]